MHTDVKINKEFGRAKNLDRRSAIFSIIIAVADELDLMR